MLPASSCFLGMSKLIHNPSQQIRKWDNDKKKEPDTDQKHSLTSGTVNALLIFLPKKAQHHVTTVIF